MDESGSSDTGREGMTTVAHSVVMTEERVINVVRRRRGTESVEVEEVCEVTVTVRARVQLTEQELDSVLRVAIASATEGSGQPVEAVDLEANDR